MILFASFLVGLGPVLLFVFLVFFRFLDQFFDCPGYVFYDFFYKKNTKKRSVLGGRARADLLVRAR